MSYIVFGRNTSISKVRIKTVGAKNSPRQKKSLTLWHIINLGTVGFRQIISKSCLTNFHSAAMKTKKETVFLPVMQLLSNKVL